MLVSTRIVVQYGARTQIARDWRVVNIPEEDTRRTDILRLYRGIVGHIYDTLETYNPPIGADEAPLRAMIGQTQNANFQDIPLNVCLADTVALFGVYIKFIVNMLEEESIQDVSPVEKNAFSVRLF